MWALTRQNILARACPPYLDWTHKSLGIEGGGIGGPAMIRIGNDIYAAGRFVGPSLLAQGNKIATSLWKHDEAADRLERIADLPMT